MVLRLMRPIYHPDRDVKNYHSEARPSVVDIKMNHATALILNVGLPYLWLGGRDFCLKNYAGLLHIDIIAAIYVQNHILTTNSRIATLPMAPANEKEQCAYFYCTVRPLLYYSSSIPVDPTWASVKRFVSLQFLNLTDR
jgi:hypothetical protein